MSNIKLLPEFLINQIAAGEVVERPASVIKELLENSLDAGATHITVEIKDGGDTFLRVTDDGCGMDKDDAVMAFERHATSKIATPEDLTNIHSLGFRGEAIASIASVSTMILQTKKRGEMEGVAITSEGGKLDRIKAAGVPEGTQIEVKQLFFNTPARKKYLKNPVTEYNHIFNTVSGLALAFPQVAFKLVHDEKVVFDLPVCEANAEGRLLRIRALMGRNVADELIPVFYGHSRISLEGFIGKPLIARSNRNGQYLFVNNREVKSHVLSYAAKESYHSLLPKEKHPVFFFYFQIDPELVDVNVHPRKQEVRFVDEREIFRIISQACQKSLETHILAPNIREGVAANYYAGGAAGNRSGGHFGGMVDYAQQLRPAGLKLEDRSTEGYQARNPEPALVQAALGFTKEITQGELVLKPIVGNQSLPGQTLPELHGQLGRPLAHEELMHKFAASQMRENAEEIFPLTQLANSYILCQQGSHLVIVDQHAAHERIRYTEILQEFEQQEKAVQPLLTPFQFELSQSEISTLEENREILKNMGFEIENFGGNTFVIHAVPSFVVQEDLQKTILGLIDDLHNQTQKGDFQNRKERSLTYMACRSAKKFGDPLSREEQVALIKKLMTLDLPYTCPHGRPTMVVMSADELKKRFGRYYA